MFSKACEYGIRAMIYIVANSAEGKKAGIKEIASSTGSPEAFMGKVLQSLAKQGIIASSKGPNGGFYIENYEEDIPIIKVVTAIDGPGMFSTCGLGLKQCSSAFPCPIHQEYKEIRDKLQVMLSNNTIQGLATKLDSGGAFLTLQ
jgi:Rrf2 family transcriptional regulator, iron-sulfur cluster assembly transcription factor